MPTPKAEAEWAARAGAFLKRKLRDQEVGLYCSAGIGGGLA